MRMADVFDKVFRGLKAEYSTILAAAAIGFAILIVYWQDLSIIANEALTSESFSHVLLVPFLVVFLLHQKKEMVKASVALEKLQRKARVVTLDEIIGLALCLSAFLLYWYGSYTFYPVEYHLASLPLLVAGLSLILFNRNTLLTVMFPILFLLFLVPPPSTITYTAGALMADLNTHASYTLLRTAGLPVTLSSAYGAPTIAVTSTSGQIIPFAVDLACSGIYSLTAFAMFATFLAFIIRGSILKRIALFVLGFCILIVLNIVRITTIVFIGYQFGEEIAMTLFHTFTGWILIFFGVLLLLLVAEKLLHLRLFSTSAKVPQCPECKMTNPHDFCQSCGRFLGKSKPKISRSLMAKIVAVLLGCYLVTLSINAPVFALAQGPGLASQDWQESTEVFPEFSAYSFQFLDRDTHYETISGQDASLTYAYYPLDASNFTVFVLLGVADSLTNLHSWEICLVTWQTAQGSLPRVQVLDSKDVQILQNPPIIARYLVFHNPQPNYTQATLYWYERALFRIGPSIQQKYVRISLIALAKDPTSYRTRASEIEERLSDFAQSITEYWEPLKQQSLISIGVPLQQSLLTGSVAFAAILGVVQYTDEKRRKNSNLKIFGSFATPDEKLVLETLRNLDRDKREITFESVRSALKKASHRTMESARVREVLDSLEEYKILKKHILNVQNNPKLIWKL